jgi:hypothetical protein
MPAIARINWASSRMTHERVHSARAASQEIYADLILQFLHVPAKSWLSDSKLRRGLGGRD